MKNTMQIRLIVLLVMFSFFSAAIIGGVNSYMNVSAAKEEVARNNQTIAGQGSLTNDDGFSTQLIGEVVIVNF